MTKEQLGRYSWGILHSMAASYPQKPTKEDKENLKTFLFTLYNNFNVVPNYIPVEYVEPISKRC